MWSQIVGKVALALMPPMNHFWYVALHIRPRGLSTLLLPHGPNRRFTMTFDFVTHDLVLQSSDEAIETIPLEPHSVKAFYEIVMDTLRRMGLETRIWPMPVEIPNFLGSQKSPPSRVYIPNMASVVEVSRKGRAAASDESA